MSNLFKTRDLELIVERIRRMLKNKEIGSEVFIRDITTLVEALENMDEIIFRGEV